MIGEINITKRDGQPQPSKSAVQDTTFHSNQGFQHICNKQMEVMMVITKKDLLFTSGQSKSIAKELTTPSSGALPPWPFSCRAHRLSPARRQQWPVNIVQWGSPTLAFWLQLGSSCRAHRLPARRHQWPIKVNRQRGHEIISPSPRHPK